jgi:hypothetical protein
MMNMALNQCRKRENITLSQQQLSYVLPSPYSCGFVLIACYAVFHVTDQLGNKLTDESLILYIQQVSLSLSLSPYKYAYMYNQSYIRLSIHLTGQVFCRYLKLSAFMLLI